MNEKISFPDLVGLLSSKMNITKKEAETFLKEFFTVSTEIITSGEELRINGLGLFKPIWVEARGSINIQTGEPVEIRFCEKFLIKYCVKLLMPHFPAFLSKSSMIMCRLRI